MSEPWDDWGVDRKPGLTREEMAERAKRSTEAFIAEIETMPEEALARPAAVGIWSGHEVVAHCVVWHDYVVEVLRRSLDGTFRVEDFEYPDVDEYNERTAAELAPLPTSELLARLRSAARTVGELLDRLPEEEWRARDRYEVVVTGELVDHLDEHMEDLRKLG
jgi:hypothetical protein